MFLFQRLAELIDDHRNHEVIAVTDPGDRELMANSEGVHFGEGAVLPSGVAIPAAPSGKVWMALGGRLVLRKKPTDWGV